MRVGDLVGYISGDGPTGIVLASWLETQPGIGIEEAWCKVLWYDGVISEDEVCGLERVEGAICEDR